MEPLDWKENEMFTYTYSAKQQEEIKTIRQKYEACRETDDGMERLRRLDARAGKRATFCSVTIGLLGTILMGIGMSLCLSELGEMLGLIGEYVLIVGSVIGILGILLISVAYPIYRSVLRRERRRIAPEILRLTDELLR